MHATTVVRIHDSFISKGELFDEESPKVDAVMADIRDAIKSGGGAVVRRFDGLLDESLYEYDQRAMREAGVLLMADLQEQCLRAARRENAVWFARHHVDPRNENPNPKL